MHHLFHYQECAPRAPLSWSHSTHSWMPMAYSHALVSEKRPTPLLMDRRVLLQVLRHPARDHVDAHSVQCVWLSDVWASSALHNTLGVMLRSVEASVQGHLSEGCHPKHQERLGLAHRSRLARQTTPVYSRVSGTVSYCGRHPAGGPGHHSPVRAGSVRLCHQEPQGLTCLSRDSHGSRVGPS
ncbi:Hypothetical protein DHA2_153228 [Giardia duodenalis]|uniref:Uncharacterized protein n=1 Tax=Giardia intestinalis TaxID=5741 RepID=V6T9L6_GIAIN|nr:Hypothetical protein DHA2_153228 [Giardia intestinalis]